MAVEIKRRASTKLQAPSSNRQQRPSKRTTTPKIPNEPVIKHESFGMICNDMYKRFGAVYTNLKQVAGNSKEVGYLRDQLHELQKATRELLDQAREIDK
jgi:hypothetical protein